MLMLADMHRRSIILPILLGAVHLSPMGWLAGAEGQPAEAGPDFPRWQVQRWKTPQGLPGNWIEGALQTSDGYLWLGTPDGLYRFDRLSFFRLNSGNCPAFRSDVYKAMAEDAGGALWVATKRGVIPLHGGIARLFLAKDGLGAGETSSLSVASDGAVWVGTSAGVVRYLDGAWTRYGAPPGLEPFVHAVLADEESAVWVGIRQGPFQLDSDSGGFEAVWEWDGVAEGPEAGTVRCILRDHRGGLWFGTKQGVFRQDGDELAVWPLGEPSMEHRVKCLFEDSAGRVRDAIG